VVVVGKHEPIRFYELIGKLEENHHPKVLKRVKMYEEGLKCYRAREFQRAFLLFEEILATIAPEDKATQLMLKRCRQYIQNPPPPDWDGVFISSKK
jgi:adenylate cyclase